MNPDVASVEPDPVALLWFALCWTVACVAALVLAGVFPLSGRPDLAGKPAAALALGDALLLAVLAGGTAWFGISRLRWTSLVLAGGAVLLFAPGLFHLWPERLRDGRAGLALLFALLGGAVAVLGAVGGGFQA